MGFRYVPCCQHMKEPNGHDTLDACFARSIALLDSIASRSLSFPTWQMPFVRRSVHRLRNNVVLADGCSHTHSDLRMLGSFFPAYIVICGTCVRCWTALPGGFSKRICGFLACSVSGDYAQFDNNSLGDRMAKLELLSWFMFSSTCAHMVLVRIREDS